MGFRRGHLALAIAVLVIAAVVESTASGTTLRVLIKHTPNKSESNRTRATINAIGSRIERQRAASASSHPSGSLPRMAHVRILYCPV
jgi:hypothetical protein